MASQAAQNQPRSGEFPCHKCGKILSRRDALLRHTRTAHQSGEHFWCQEHGCIEARKGYRRFRDFQKHMRVAHNKIVSADDVASQKTLRENHRAARENEPQVVTQALHHTVTQNISQNPHQASRQSIHEDSQPIAQVTPQLAPVAAPHANLRVNPQAGPRVASQAGNYILPEDFQLRPVYEPDYTMYGGRSQPFFRHSDVPVPRAVSPGHIPDDVRDLLRAVDYQASMYEELLEKYNKLQTERDELAVTLDSLLKERQQYQN